MDHPKAAVPSPLESLNRPSGKSGGSNQDRRRWVFPDLGPDLRRALGPALAIAAFGGLILLERQRPLRRRVEPQVPRAGRNLAMAAAAALALRLVEKSVVEPEPLAETVERHRRGLLKRMGLNWSSGLTLWDRLHRTLRLDVPQDRITIGLPAYRDPADLSTARLFLMPFRRQRPTWRSPSAEQSPDHPCQRRPPQPPWSLFR